MKVLFQSLQRLAQGSTVACVLFGGRWLLPTFFLLALLAGRMFLCIAFASVHQYNVLHPFFLFERDVGLKRIHHEKWRNFDKISLKAFNQIELKKWKHCQILFGETSRKKTCFANMLTKALSFFPEEIQIYLRLVFSWEACFHRMTSREKLFWHKSRSKFSPKLTMRYVSKWRSYK